MSTEVKVPMLPESVADATVVTWHKKVGDTVKRDENLVDLETDKVVLEVPSPVDGVLEEITQQNGATVIANDLLAKIKEGASADATAPVAEKTTEKPAEQKEQPASNNNLAPSVRRLVAEKEVDVKDIKGSGVGGRLTKEDVMNQTSSDKSAPVAKNTVMDNGDRPEKRVPMSRIRAKVAERLLQAQHNAAMLTTFNEINLQSVMDLRNLYKEKFEKMHNVKLGFMSFFTKAVVEALKRFPAVNASIDGQDIVYHGYYDIGIAVSTERGLVVPVIRDADHLSMSDIEKNINDSAGRAREGKLSIEEMQGGTFTITNGGVFGSLLSTPIINPPQTAILGMHKIEQRAVVENGLVVVRPMMYVALSYDHRLIDGKDSVQFLVTVKEFLEDPARLLLDV